MAIPAEAFFLDPDGDGTLQQRIQRLVVEGILAGRYLPGERMPSSRRLSEHLGVSRITVTIAYTNLVADDYLIARGRSGYFVSDTAPTLPNFDLGDRETGDEVEWTRVFGRRFSEGLTLARPVNWQSFPYPFVYGQADPELLDHQNWRLCALQALGQKDFEALTSDYYERDDPKLVEYILRHMLPRRGISARPDNILITLGAQNALWITSEILLTQRRTAVMENPGYPGLRDILSHTRCKTATVDVDDQGLPPDALPDEVDALFLTASHHCPTNATMPLDRRKRLLALAGDRNFFIVEDDYEFEISFQRSPVPALKSLDETGSVIYIGSFSKSIFPGMRLGFIVASPAFIREARALRAMVLRHPPGHIQRTAAYFLSLGHYDAQITRMRKVFGQRRATMLEAIHANGLDLASSPDAGGSSLWMRAPDGVDTGHLAQALYKKGVVIEPGSVFFADPPAPCPYYRLAYSSIPAKRIPKGIELVAEAIRSMARPQAAE